MRNISFQLIIFAILIGISGISWAIRKLREQAKLKSELADRERRRNEYLRTGRDPGDTGAQPVAVNDAQARLRELAARRQAQLRALREQQRPAAHDDEQPEPVAGPVRTQLWPGGPVIEVAPKPARTPAARAPVPRAPAQRAPAPRAPAPRPSPQPVRATNAAQMIEASRAKRQRDAEKTSRARELAAAAEARERAAAVARRRAAAAVTAPPSDPSADEPPEGGRRDQIAFSPPTTPAQWRAALIASEVLGPPLAFRRLDQMPGITA